MMKKYLLIMIGFCLSIISFDLIAQNSVEVTAFLDQNGNGIDDEALTAPGLTTGELFLTQVGTGTVFNHTELAAGVYTFGDGLTLPDGDYFLTYVETPWTPAAINVGSEVFAITLLNAGGATMDNDVDPISGQSANFNVTGGATEVDIDLGVYFATAIGDLVWEDINGDGLTDGELGNGIGGVNITLLDGTGAAAVDTDGNAVPAQATMADGSYLFGNLAPGDYIVQFSLPTLGGLNWYPTTFNGTDPDFANDSDADPNNAFQSPVYSVGPNIIYNENIDAGFFVPAVIGDMVFCDTNGDGIDNDGAGGVDDVEVRIVHAGGPQAGNTADDADGNPMQMTTNGGGMYGFNLAPPTPDGYFVEFAFTPGGPSPSNPPFVFTIQDEAAATDDTDSDADPTPGGTFGQTATFFVTSQDNEEETRWDAGVYQVFVITGDIWFDDDLSFTLNGAENGPGGIQVNLIDADNGTIVDMMLTNAGTYEFPSNPAISIGPGNYIVELDFNNFGPGGALEVAEPCAGLNPAGDMVDNDDNGNDQQPEQSTVFTLESNCDPLNAPFIEYIDFCYFISCNDLNPLAASACGNIQTSDIICQIETLGSFCAIMPSENSTDNDLTPNLCPGGGAPHNISWFAFQAYGGVYSVTVTPTNCSGSTTGIEGVQIGLYTDCTFTESVYCEPGCNTDPVSFDSDVLEEGQTYYFFIDGCSSSVCSYEVEITGNPLPPNLNPDCVAINDNGSIECLDATYCPDTEVIFEIEGLDLDADFTWTVAATSGGPYEGDGTPTTIEDVLSITFTNEGEYVVCISNISNGCQNWSGSSTCRTIIIEGIDDEVFDDQTICQEDLPSFNLNIFDPVDPNTDGTTGWQAQGTVPDFGTVMGTVTTPQGCMYDQEFELMMHPIADKGLVDLILCKDEFPVQIDNNSFSLANFGGNLELSVTDVLLQNSSDFNGCDSVIDINLEVLDLFTLGLMTPEPCLPEGLPLVFEFDPSLSTDVSFMTFEWIGPDNQPLTDEYNPLDPQDNIAPSGVSGTYTLNVTITKEGKECTFPFTIEVDFDDLLPSVPTITGPPAEICESDSIQTYTAADIDPADGVFNYIWTITPAGTEILDGGGVNDESVQINWAGVANGSVSLEVVNGCGNSMPVDVAVELIPLLTPDFDFTAEVCQDSIAIITFNGDQTVIDGYTWDFDGGTINNGADPNSAGPFDIIWSDASTDKTITLSVTHNGGCASIETDYTVTLVEPLVAPTVTCNPETGQVVFTWPDVPDAVGYDVNVSTGQTGVLDDVNNSYTFSSLADGETVTIELIVLTGDACVMVVSSASSCTSQNCVAPTVTLDAGAGIAEPIEICTADITGNINIVPAITSGESGTGEFTGPGIVDAVNGTFDPAAADIGVNTINYVFMTDDAVPCIGTQSIEIEIIETPMASFMTDTDTICVTEEFQLTYDGTTGPNEINWTTSDNQSFNGSTPTVSFPSAGEYTIMLEVVKDGCLSTMVERTVVVQPELDQVVASCLQQELDFVEFGWNAVDGATGYNVTVTLPDGTMDQFTTTDITHLVGSLNPDDIVTIVVEVLTDSRCPGNTSTAQPCTAQACPTFTIDFPQTVIPVCVDGSSPLIDLMATASGGVGGGDYTWSGSGNIVNDNQFDPNGLPEGPVELFVTYNEDGCEGAGSLMVEITQTPTATFDVTPDAICIGSTIPITFTGSNLPGQSIDWSGSDVTVNALGGNDYEATFSTEGTFNIMLDVTNGACTTAPAMSTVTVEPELVFGAIDCNEELDEITFSWLTVDCASEYEVFVNINGAGEVSQGIQTDVSYTQTGLVDGDEVEIRVEAVSGCACGNVESTRMCEAKPCVTVDLSLSPMGGVTDFCFEDGLPMVEIMPTELNATADGVGSWTGMGVDANGMFSPSLAGVGTHVITYTFVEPEGCQDFVETITFNVFDVPTVEPSFDPITCYDETNTMLNLVATGGDGNYSLTLNGDVAMDMNDVAAGSYAILVTDGNGCTSDASVDITIPDEPQPEIDGSLELIVGETSNYSINSALFTGQAIDSIVWTANGAVVCNDAACFSLSNEAPEVNTSYTVTVFYNEGCSVTRTIDVEVREPDPISLVTIPNAFSPNDDGKNDTWKITSNDPEVVIRGLKVYDRWGNLVFGSNVSAFNPALNNDVEWDGTYNNTDMQPGVYVYFVDFVQEGRDRIRSGDLTIVR